MTQTRNRLPVFWLCTNDGGIVDDRLSLIVDKILPDRNLTPAVKASSPGARGGVHSEETRCASRNSFRAVFLGFASAAALAAPRCPADAANKPLKIGFVGVTSGPAAAWGTSNVRSMQTLADWWNSNGGVKIGDDTYDIDVVTFDDQKDPKRSIDGMEKMAQEGIHYVVGPNVDDGAAAVRPVAKSRGSSISPTPSRKSSTPSPPPTRCSAWSRAISPARRSTNI